MEMCGDSKDDYYAHIIVSLCVHVLYWMYDPICIFGMYGLQLNHTFAKFLAYYKN